MKEKKNYKFYVRFIHVIVLAHKQPKILMEKYIKGKVGVRCRAGERAMNLPYIYKLRYSAVFFLCTYECKYMLY